MRNHYHILLILVSFTCCKLASLEAAKYPPTRLAYVTESGRFVIRITPAQFTNQEKISSCRASIFEWDESKKMYINLFEIELINQLCPDRIIISEDGSLIMTLDEWGGGVNAKNAIVIYKVATGAILKKYNLEDFIPTHILTALPKFSSWPIWRVGLPESVPTTQEVKIRNWPLPRTVILTHSTPRFSITIPFDGGIPKLESEN